MVCPRLGVVGGTQWVSISTSQKRRMRRFSNHEYMDSTYLQLPAKFLLATPHGSRAMWHEHGTGFSRVEILKSAAHEREIQANIVHLPCPLFMVLSGWTSSSFVCFGLPYTLIFDLHSNAVKF
jgi:hypothetical protein